MTPSRVTGLGFGSARSTAIAAARPRSSSRIPSSAKERGIGSRRPRSNNPAGVSETPSALAARDIASAAAGALYSAVYGRSTA